MWKAELSYLQKPGNLDQILADSRGHRERRLREEQRSDKRRRSRRRGGHTGPPPLAEGQRMLPVSTAWLYLAPAGVFLGLYLVYPAINTVYMRA